MLIFKNKKEIEMETRKKKKWEKEKTQKEVEKKLHKQKEKDKINDKWGAHCQDVRNQERLECSLMWHDWKPLASGSTAISSRQSESSGKGYCCNEDRH